MTVNESEHSMSPERISVCMATYNGSKYIKIQLESILSQLNYNDEIIISDDSSTDNTLSIISSFQDSRIKVFPGQKFRSPVYNFENAIKNATGNVIFLSDQDDKWLPGKVKRMIQELDDCDLILSNCYIGDADLNIIKESFFEWRNSRKGLMKNMWRNSYLGCCMCFRKKILAKVLPFPKHLPMHDMWIGIVTEFYYKPKFLEEKLMIYRRHEHNVTVINKDFSSKENFYKRLKFRLSLLSALLKRVASVA